MQRKNFLNYYTTPKYRVLFRWVDFQKKQVLRSLLNGKQKILELGAGDAAILRSLKLPTFFVGDINPDLLAIARHKQESLYCCQLSCDNKLPFKDNSFDVVVMIDSIEHMKFPHLIAREVSRILTPSGSFIIFTPPYDSITWVIGEKIHDTITHGRSDHITPFTSESLTYLLECYFCNVKIRKLNSGISMCGIGRKRLM